MKQAEFVLRNQVGAVDRVDIAACGKGWKIYVGTLDFRIGDHISRYWIETARDVNACRVFASLDSAHKFVRSNGWHGQIVIEDDQR